MAVVEKYLPLASTRWVDEPPLPNLWSDTEREWKCTFESHRKRFKNTLEEQFHDLSTKWREEVAFVSMTDEIVMNMSYQRIIGMGKPVIPFILRDLVSTNDHWFWALEALTGENPVAPEDRGNIAKMVSAWVEWANKNGWTIS